MKRTLLVAAFSMMLGANAFADTASCTTDAAGKKLAGAALTSFMKKCEGDAKSTCEKTSAEKKLAGAAKTSFEKKCLEDATGKK